MLIVVSPAKSLDIDSPIPTRKHSEPRLVHRSAELVRQLATYTPDEVASLLSISPKLAELNADRYADWHVPFTPDNARQALFLFNGDTYQGMDVRATFDARDLTRAQKTLRILSGLYGVLRPLDLIQPYRLEMGTRLATAKGTDLYQFWGHTLTEMLADDLKASPGGHFVVNLASTEYFSAITPNGLGGSLVSPRFLDYPAGGRPGGKPKIISFHAKRARGAMAAWLIRERINTTRALAQFNGLGYVYDSDRSTPGEPTFVRSTF